MKGWCEMGTRGALGFWKDGEHKVTYNHFDSYPDGLGKDVLEYINNNSIEQMNQHFDNIRLIGENENPTELDIKRCQEFTDLGVSNQSTSDWYCLLRQAQGKLEAYGKARMMIDAQDFLHDGLFCEYAYIINLTDETLEFYEGFQKSKPDGRYSEFEPDGDYFAVGLIKVTPLAECVRSENFVGTEEIFPEPNKED